MKRKTPTEVIGLDLKPAKLKRPTNFEDPKELGDWVHRVQEMLLGELNGAPAEVVVGVLAMLLTNTGMAGRFTLDDIKRLVESVWDHQIAAEMQR